MHSLTRLLHSIGSYAAPQHDSTYFGQHLSQNVSPSHDNAIPPADLSDPSQGLSYFKLQPSADQPQRKTVISPYLAGAKKLADDVNRTEEEESKEEQEKRKEEDEEEDDKMRAGVHFKSTEFEPGKLFMQQNRAPFYILHAWNVSAIMRTCAFRKRVMNSPLSDRFFFFFNYLVIVIDSLCVFYSPFPTHFHPFPPLSFFLSFFPAPHASSNRSRS